MRRITAGVTGHQREARHFTPGRLSASRARRPSMGVLLWGALMFVADKRDLKPEALYQM